MPPWRLHCSCRARCSPRCFSTQLSPSVVRWSTMRCCARMRGSACQPRRLRWTAAHAALVRCLRAAYDTFGLQLFVAIAIVAARRDRAALWEFVTEYHLCLGIAIAACATWPATEPWAYRHLADLAGQSRAVAQIAGFHARTLLTIDVNQPVGLVAMPSFHVAGAWMLVWAVRRSRPALWTFLGLNTVLTAATVLLGVHYAVDALAGAALFVACAGLYHAAANADARILNVMALRLRTPRPSSAPFA